MPRERGPGLGRGDTLVFMLSILTCKGFQEFPKGYSIQDDNHVSQEIYQTDHGTLVTVEHVIATSLVRKDPFMAFRAGETIVRRQGTPASENQGTPGAEGVRIKWERASRSLHAKS